MVSDPPLASALCTNVLDTHPLCACMGIIYDMIMPLLLPIDSMLDYGLCIGNSKVWHKVVVLIEITLMIILKFVQVVKTVPKIVEY